jgi:hypothetical protein
MVTGIIKDIGEVMVSVNNFVRAKPGQLRIRRIGLSGATCLPKECCFSELAL